jgi:hypothetical protein
MDELAPEIIRLNDQLLGKIADAPLLASPQQSLIRKLYKDQVKSRGGFDAIKLTREDAGAPFSSEQIAQIQPFFDQQMKREPSWCVKARVNLRIRQNSINCNATRSRKS